MTYIQLLNLEDDDFEVTSASTPEEIKKLEIAGWIKYDEITINRILMHFCKKSKKFSTA
jgi:hypothetical protein